MPAFLCETCGSQFTPSDEPPPGCPVCQDERQFMPPGGQKWTTLDALARRHFNSYRQHEPGLIGIGTVPKFSIGQRALLLRTPGGNILWDCIPFVDDATVEIVKLIPDRTHVSFMRSYPNIIPLSAPAVARIGAMLEPFSYDVIYGAFFDRVIPRGGKDAVKRSVARYLKIVTGDGTAEQV